MAPLPTWVVFGDSITQLGGNRDGWVAGLAELYGRKADILNRGFGGFNTRWGLKIFDRVFDGFKDAPPALVTVFFGANDAAIADRVSASQHVPLAEYTANLGVLAARLKALGVPRIVFVGPPPVDESVRMAKVFERYGVVIDAPERLNAAAGAYSAAASEAARAAGVPFVELWRHLQATEGWEKELLTDGIHLTAKGNDLVLRALLETIRGEWPEQSPEALPFLVPHGADLIALPDPQAALEGFLEREERART